MLQLKYIDHLFASMRVMITCFNVSPAYIAQLLSSALSLLLITTTVDTAMSDSVQTGGGGGGGMCVCVCVYNILLCV